MPMAVLCCAVMSSNVPCRVELCRALLHCGSGRSWHQNPDRTDLDLKLSLPERKARAGCSPTARGARPARAQDLIQFRNETNQEGATPSRRETHREWTDRSAANQNATNCIKTNRTDTNRDDGRTDPNRSETKQTKTGKSRVRFGTPS